MHEAVVERARLSGDLGRAARAGELVLHYQPIVDLDSGRMTGAEALVRFGERPTASDVDRMGHRERRVDRIDAAHEIAVPRCSGEGREILARQTVLENLELATWARRDGAATRTRIDAVLKRFPILGERRDLSAGSLSGGEQQMLAIARGLLARPRLLLLDEPSLGLAPQMVDEVFRAIEEIHKDGTTILLVEQNALRALAIADRAYVIETGRILLSGSGDDLLHNPAVRRAYLGG